MEKLQAALKKARTQRNNNAKENARGAQSATRREPASSKADQSWAALREFPLSKQGLVEHRIVAQSVSHEATPFDVLRTKILLEMQGKGWKRLGITSPTPKSGKTTMACNLTLGLGRQEGLKTMLFDFDLGDPSVSKFLNLRETLPISDMLQGNTPYEEHLIRLGDTTAIAGTGRTETDPTRVLLSSKTGNTLSEIQETYEPDIMLFDLPSVLVGDNTRAFLRQLDCVLIVARANSTKYSDYDKCEREVAVYTSVLGTVLNASRVQNLDQ